MSRYIDADKPYTRVKEKTNPYGKPTLDYESGVKVLDMIKEAPTADVVEVVRCKDCIHFETITLDSGISVGIGNCKNKNGINLYPKETDFCSYGERSDT